MKDVISNRKYQLGFAALFVACLVLIFTMGSEKEVESVASTSTSTSVETDKNLETQKDQTNK